MMLKRLPTSDHLPGLHEEQPAAFADKVSLTAEMRMDGKEADDGVDYSRRLETEEPKGLAKRWHCIIDGYGKHSMAQGR